ncbi:MAG: nucleotide exchange factor GrpE [Fibromonadaceae bacterium]|jgi:molecular chaperone GrpE|nr:nucleotide exchange factor GrpE [Fibromonadaceae bacterium]
MKIQKRRFLLKKAVFYAAWLLPYIYSMEETLDRKEISEEVDKLIEESAEESVAEGTEKETDKEKAAHDKYLRLFAEFENYRTRSAKEQLEIINTANGKLLAKLSVVKDNFERAFAEENKTGDLAAFEKGVRLIQEQFNKVLEEFGLETMDPTGQPFDPNMHEALMNQPSETVPEGEIIQVFQKGYRIKNKLLRVAKVIVSSGKPA